jgi:hypothetical protein
MIAKMGVWSYGFVEVQRPFPQSSPSCACQLLLDCRQASCEVTSEVVFFGIGPTKPGLGRSRVRRAASAA